MNINLIKKYFKIAKRNKFNTDKLVDPTSHICLMHKIGHNDTYIISMTYDAIELDVNSTKFGPMFSISYHIPNDSLEVCLRDDGFKYTRVNNVSVCLLEEGYFQETLIQNLKFNQAEIKYLISEVNELKEIVLDMCNISEQKPSGVKC